MSVAPTAFATTPTPLEQLQFWLPAASAWLVAFQKTRPLLPASSGLLEGCKKRSVRLGCKEGCKWASDRLRCETHFRSSREDGLERSGAISFRAAGLQAPGHNSRMLACTDDNTCAQDPKP